MSFETRFHGKVQRRKISQRRRTARILLVLCRSVEVCIFVLARPLRLSFDHSEVLNEVLPVLQF